MAFSMLDSSKEQIKGSQTLLYAFVLAVLVISKTLLDSASSSAYLYILLFCSKFLPIYSPPVLYTFWKSTAHLQSHFPFLLVISCYFPANVTHPFSSCPFFLLLESVVYLHPHFHFFSASLASPFFGIPP